jgi:hypothetical protein
MFSHRDCLLHTSVIILSPLLLPQRILELENALVLEACFLSSQIKKAVRALLSPRFHTSHSTSCQLDRARCIYAGVCHMEEAAWSRSFASASRHCQGCETIFGASILFNVNSTSIVTYSTFIHQLSPRHCSRP